MAVRSVRVSRLNATGRLLMRLIKRSLQSPLAGVTLKTTRLMAILRQVRPTLMPIITLLLSITLSILLVSSIG